MPGCGKSAVGRRLAPRLGMSFVDADEEIERAAGKPITDIFKDHGEPYFRDGERRVIARLLAAGPQVLATGGGAFMVAETRENIGRSGISVWLKAELPLLMRRVLKKNNRPLLMNDPEASMKRLMTARYPIYATADITVETREVPHEVIVGEIIQALSERLGVTADSRRRPQPRRGHMSGRPVTAPGQDGTGEPARIRVALGDRSYDVLIGQGLLAQSGALIAERVGKAKCAVVTDANVARTIWRRCRRR